MKFDVFHSVGRIDSVPRPLSDREVFQSFFEQAILAENLGYQTVWVAESHFSSQVQKSGSDPVIPHYQGEVGLNADCCQLAQKVLGMTKSIGFGTAIMNIVGGNGGPIAAADRIRSLAFLNGLQNQPRRLHIGVAAGRFPYINRPFGISPRNAVEKVLWPQYKQIIFLEALEVFLRLLNDEELSSEDLSNYEIDRSFFRSDEGFTKARDELAKLDLTFPQSYQRRWEFERLCLIPKQPVAEWSKFMNFVLGSSDPMAREVGLRHTDLDIFNLSFTPPEKLNLLHTEMEARYRDAGRVWARHRLPRTVLVFIDDDPAVAQQHASDCFDTYMDAMQGTVHLPPKDFLMARALVGSPEMIREQLSVGHEKGFHPEDRLMLWFEFNQTDHARIMNQMRMFAERVIPYVANS